MREQQVATRRSGLFTLVQLCMGAAMVVGLGTAPALGAVRLTVTDDWGTGFQALVRIDNGEPRALTNWRVEFDLDHRITSLWNAQLTAQQGLRYVVTHPTWSDTIPAGGSVEFGFIAEPGNVSGLNASFQLYADGTSSPPLATSTATRAASSTPTRTASVPPPSATPTRSSAVTPAPAGGRRMVGYYPSWATYDRNFQVLDIGAERLTHINYAFANISSAGDCILGDPYADVDKFFPGDSWEAGARRGNFHQLELLKAAHPHLRTLISVGGWTWSGRFSDVALTAQSRQRFVASCVQLMRQWRFDGIDIDWEYPVGGGLPGNTNRPEDRRNYTLLMQEFRTQLDAAGAADGRSYLLTIAAGAGADKLANLELPALAAILDWINVMTYDYHGSWEAVTNFNAPLRAAPGDPSGSQLNVAWTMQAFRAAGVTADKLVVGMPFYGRGWGCAGSTNNGLYQSAGCGVAGTWEPGVFDYRDLAANYVGRNGYTRYWSSDALVPFLYNPSARVFISYDDGESIARKADYVLQEGFGGAMFWELSADNGDLLRTLAERLAVPPGTRTISPVASATSTRTPPLPTSTATQTPAAPATATRTAGIPATATRTFTTEASPTATVRATATSTAAASPTPSPSPAGPTSAVLTFMRTSTWGTGFVAVFTLRNVGALPIDGWTLGFDTAPSVHVTSLWGGIWARSGNRHTVSAETWNRVITPGTAVDIGFSAEIDDAFIAPRNCALNGVALDCGAPPDTARPSTYFLDPSSYVPAGRIDLGEGRLEPVWFEPFDAEIPINRPGWAIAIAHAEQILRNLIELDGYSPSAIFATAIKESKLGCDAGALPRPESAFPFVYVAAAAHDGCFQIEDGSAYTQLTEVYPQRFPVGGHAQFVATSHFETAAIAKAYYDVFSLRILESRGWDPAEWLATAADPQAAVKVISVAYNRGQWSPILEDIFVHRREDCRRAPELVAACVGSTGFAPDHARAIADYTAVLEDRADTLRPEIRPLNWFARFYDAPIAWSDVDAYLTAILPLYPEIDAAVVRGRVRTAFDMMASGRAAVSFQHELGTVLDAIMLSLPVDDPRNRIIRLFGGSFDP